MYSVRAGAAPRAMLGAYYFEGWSEDNDFHL